ncbi:MAG: Amino-acid carrier protein AlsT [Chlamydiae bacterium]|nr:Amino-acid carrier protein AlsT [Chlamydiota bacterium]
MEIFEASLIYLKDLIWSIPLLLLLFGTGVYLTYILKGVQFRYLGYAFKQVVAPKRFGAKGDITPFESLMTSLAGAIGTGSIVGVSTAVAIGGFGAIFWMWVTALLGMATKYAESLLAVKYRVVDKRGEMVGGPMEYIERGIGWKWMAIVFSLFASVAAIGTGNLVQINSIAEAVESVWGINTWLTGIVVAILVGLVLIGGVKAIGRFAGVLVPVMGAFYLLGGFVVLALNFTLIPDAFKLIFSSAFTGQAAVGGFAGSTLLLAIQMGVSRSVFSNEAGLGISSISAAAAQTDSPARQAMISMTGALLSTVIVCTVTGLVLAVTGVLGAYGNNGVMLKGASMTLVAFETSFYGGSYVVTIGLVLFAFSTILAWAYYGEKCCEYLLGERSIPIYRILYSCVIIPGAAIKMEIVWLIADVTNGLMVIPNLIALIMLSSVIVKETEAFLVSVEREEHPSQNGE